MADNDQELRPTHMDDLLKELVARTYGGAIEHYLKGEYQQCFKCYQSLLSMILPFEFERKQELIELSEIIGEYMKGLQNKPLNLASQIQYKNTTIAFRQLVQTFMTQIPQAYAELGMWFKVIHHYNDMSKMNGERFFNDSTISTVENKKKELGKLDKKKILEIMTPNAVHDCYAKMVMENAV